MRTAFATLQFQTTNYDSSWQNIFNQINRTEEVFFFLFCPNILKISLYQHHLTRAPFIRKGVTMSEIADLIEKMYGHHYTPQTMSNMTKVLTEEVNAFKSRALNDKYVAIFMDATYIPLKRQTVSKEAIYIAIGIREDGTKEVLSYAIAPTESTYVWNELLGY